MGYMHVLGKEGERRDQVGKVQELKIRRALLIYDGLTRINFTGNIEETMTAIDNLFGEANADYAAITLALIYFLWELNK